MKVQITNLITPLNIVEEQKKFFESNSYSPQFIYKWDKDIITPFLNERPEYKGLMDALLSQDHGVIVAQAKKRFQTDIEADILELAKEILKKKPQENEFPTIPFQEVTSKFNKAFKFLNLNYRLRITDRQGFNFRPILQKKELLMSSSVNFQFFSVESGIKHELTHIIRYENGEYNKIPRSLGYLPTEEGLASYAQDCLGENKDRSVFQHAAEYAVTEVALHGSLRDMYEYLCSIGFSPENAWQRGIRHKFGFQDTSLPGDIMKPSMYFGYEQKIRKLPQEEILKLFVGKIALDELNSVKEYKGIVPKEKLIEFLGIKRND